MADRTDNARGRKGGVSAAEAELFEIAVRDAARLNPAGRAPPPKPQRVPRSSRAPGPAEGADVAAFSVGATGGMDRRTAERFRRGRIRPEARLDLHGRTLDEAEESVERFLAESRRIGRRCVLVVTGRGSAGAGSGVIRREFPLWLEAPANRSSVVSCVPAILADGGEGAFYVYLKKPGK